MIHCGTAVVLCTPARLRKFGSFFDCSGAAMRGIVGSWTSSWRRVRIRGEVRLYLELSRVATHFPLPQERPNVLDSVKTEVFTLWFQVSAASIA